MRQLLGRVQQLG